LEIVTIPILKDNYAFVLVDRLRQQATVFDPGESAPVIAWLSKNGLELVNIWITHHHRDHIGGIADLRQRFPAAVVSGGAKDRGRIPQQQIYLNDGDRVTFANQTAQIFFIPGHTLGHIAYYFPPSDHQPGEIFCGDTIFGGGCGRLFEGTPAQMLESIDRIRQLPATTRLWCSHEYTLNNLRFALTIEPHNMDLQNRYHQVKVDSFATCDGNRANSRPTIPSTIGLEQQTNPFLRWDVPAVSAAVASNNFVETFARLRGRKEQF
jgi:hydroxyacylglutathione hydrolase